MVRFGSERDDPASRVITSTVPEVAQCSRPHSQLYSTSSTRSCIRAERVTLEHDHDFSWLPAHGVALSKEDLMQVFEDLRALVDGTDPLDANRSHVVDIAVVITRALEREAGR